MVDQPAPDRDLPEPRIVPEGCHHRHEHVGVVREPQGVTSMLSPGTFGHGGAWGTQAWVDPARGVAYVLMIQRSDIGNSDASEVRRAFQQAAADALNK